MVGHIGEGGETVQCLTALEEPVKSVDVRLLLVYDVV